MHIGRGVIEVLKSSISDEGVAGKATDHALAKEEKEEIQARFLDFTKSFDSFSKITKNLYDFVRFQDEEMCWIEDIEIDVKGERK